MPAEAVAVHQCNGETQPRSGSVCGQAIPKDRATPLPIPDPTWSDCSQAVLFLDSDTRIAFVNPSAEHILEEVGRECTGRRISALLDRRRRSRAMAALRKGLSGRVVCTDLHLRRATGGTLELSVAGTPVFSRGGEVLGLLLIGSDRTRTRPRETEERLGELTQVMKASHSILSHTSLPTKLEQIVRSAITVLHANRCAVYLRNRQTGELECVLAKGLSWEYVRFVLDNVNRLPGRTLIDHPGPLVVEDLQKIPAIAKRAAAEGLHTAAFFPLRTEEALLGAIAFYHDSPHPYSAESLELGEILANQAAIAVHNAWQIEEIRQRAREVEAKNRQLEEFISIASHDLRSPLISIEGFTARFLKDYGHRLDAEGTRYLNRIEENTRYMYALIQSLLDLSQAASGREPVERLALDEIVAEVLRHLEAALDERRAAVEVRPLPVLRGNRIRLQQIFTNLLDNAIKYAHPRRPLRIEIGYEAPDLYVRDNGLGIPPSRLQAIFQSLYRLHDVACDGLGMGLSIVKRAVEGQGGNVWAESDGHSGSTFYLRFPSANVIRGEATQELGP